jgi:hypothetical protein
MIHIRKRIPSSPNMIEIGGLSRSAPVRAIISSKGQALVEFALTLPLLLLLALGIIEVSYGIYDQHVLIKMAREGSNLISRNTSLYLAGTAMKSMANPPVDLNSSRSLMIFSVIRLGTTGVYAGKPVIYKYRTVGNLTGRSSILSQSGQCTFYNDAAAPTHDYENTSTTNPDACLANGGTLPSGVVIPNSGQLFLTEIYNTHNLITPASKFGINVPSVLYANAYF